MSSTTSSPTDNDQPGLPASIFPQRNPEKKSELTKSGFTGWYQQVVLSPHDNMKCETLVKDTLKHPALKLLVRAMESSGCRFNPRRHVSCETCASDRVLGAYDPKYNQVAICANNCRTPDDMFTVLGYNMLQMFDSCRAHMDFRNIDHVACTEVRANNLFVCGTYRDGRKRGHAPLLGYEGKQPECVRTNAIESVRQLLNVDEPTARASVDRVFNRCYFDMEPFGQRFENERTAEILYERRRNYGYY